MFFFKQKTAYERRISDWSSDVCSSDLGTEWFEDVLQSERFRDSLLRNLAFSAIILAIEVPLGIVIALSMPRKGFWVPVCLILMALPLLIPWTVVGTIWQVFGRRDTGLLGHVLASMGPDYNYPQPASPPRPPAIV